MLLKIEVGGMRRFIVRLLVTLSTLLFVASATFWLRSYRGQEGITHISLVSKPDHAVEIIYLFEPGAGGARLSRHTWIFNERLVRALKNSGELGWNGKGWAGANLY